MESSAICSSSRVLGAAEGGPLLQGAGDVCSVQPLDPIAVQFRLARRHRQPQRRAPLARPAVGPGRRRPFLACAPPNFYRAPSPRQPPHLASPSSCGRTAQMTGCPEQGSRTVVTWRAGCTALATLVGSREVSTLDAISRAGCLDGWRGVHHTCQPRWPLGAACSRLLQGGPLTSPPPAG